MNSSEFSALIKQELDGLIGVFPNGHPAVWVDLHGDCPTGTRGILVVIERQPMVKRNVPLSGGGIDLNYDLVLQLTQYDRSIEGDSVFIQACERIRLSRRFLKQERPIPPEDGQYPRITFFCNFSRFVVCHGH